MNSEHSWLSDQIMPDSGRSKSPSCNEEACKGQYILEIIPGHRTYWESNGCE